MADEPIIAEPEPKCRTVVEYILYKLDRNIAVCGIVAISVLALLYWQNDSGLQVCTAGLGGLVALNRCGGR